MYAPYYTFACMSEKLKSAEQFIEEIKQSISGHRQQVKLLESMLKSLGVFNDDSSQKEERNNIKIINNNSFEESLKVNKYIKKKKEPTFDEVILSILSNGAPKRARSLMEEYAKITGKEMERKNFSSRLSIASKKKNITNYELKSEIGEFRYWWVQKDWFEGDLLQEKYLNSIQIEINEEKKGLHFEVL